MAAPSPAARKRWASAGLASRGARLEKTTQVMLLRQLYLSYYEARHFRRALEVAAQAIDLDVLPDVLHQDAARAALAAGDVDRGVAHLRVAARRGPPSRRPFHLWTLGSVLFLAHRYAEAVGALERAARWASREKPLYRAHLALVRIAAGDRVEDLPQMFDALAASPVAGGYGRFVLGHLAYASGAWRTARRYLEAFARRTEAAHPTLAIALARELEMTRATLAKMSTPGPGGAPGIPSL